MIWSAVFDAPGYEVSTEGGVRRVFDDGGFRTLKANVGGRGYPVVSLRVGGKTVTKTIHRMVAFAFVGPQPSPKHEVCHNDGNKLNCKVGNIRWGTKEDNAADRLRHGIDQRGAKNVDAKLTNDDVVVIRSSRLTNTELARAYSVSRATIRKVRRRQSYTETA